ncbi:hypothetical protein WJX74_004280 [Apatococcus lobatus]|uniref:Uncharacterized protein n=1 Tax=Apatococcus lobatus TaxID=904363 RepID=A0AAW1RYP4_9CHLO
MQASLHQIFGTGNLSITLSVGRDINPGEFTAYTVWCDENAISAFAAVERGESNGHLHIQNSVRSKLLKNGQTFELMTAYCRKDAGEPWYVEYQKNITPAQLAAGLQQYADIGGPRLTDAVPLTKKNAVDLAIAFRKRVMQPNAGWDLAETLFQMVSSTRYQPTTSWCLGSGFRYEAAQALFAITLDRAAATKVQTNWIFFNIDGRPQYFMQPEEVEEEQACDQPMA